MQYFDIGWSMAAPVGHGGFPDDWIEGWMPLPAPPSHSKGPLTMDDPGYRFTLRSWHVWNGR